MRAATVRRRIPSRRHPREGGDPEPSAPSLQIASGARVPGAGLRVGSSRLWIPAFAGMTGERWRVVPALDSRLRGNDGREGRDAARLRVAALGSRPGPGFPPARQRPPQTLCRAAAAPQPAIAPQPVN